MSQPLTRDAGLARAADGLDRLHPTAVSGPAEVRHLRESGASAIGMSTVQEASAARACGMRVAAVSAITNPAAGVPGPRSILMEQVPPPRGAPSAR